MKRNGKRTTHTEKPGKVFFFNFSAPTAMPKQTVQHINPNYVPQSWILLPAYVKISAITKNAHRPRFFPDPLFYKC